MFINLPGISRAVFAAIFAITTYSSLQAMGIGDSTTTTVVNPKCKKGKAWSKKRKKCVRIKKSSMVDDEDIFQTGRDLAINKRYEDAIVVLSFASDKGNPRVLNYLGYAHRKAGRIDVGLGYYNEALRIDPDYTLVREYMGEAFLQKGDLAGANNQLVEIENRCGRDCAEYAELARQITLFKASRE